MEANFQLDEQVKKLLELIQQMKAEENEQFVEHIENIRQSSDIQIIPFLVELLGDPYVDDVKKDAIYNLVMDIKHPDAAHLLVSGIKYLKGKPELQPYLAALWQNSLSFAKYIDTFADLVLSEDYLAAYDAFTIIENSASDATKGEIDATISKLKDNLGNQDEEKKPLIAELINVLDQIKNMPTEE